MALRAVMNKAKFWPRGSPGCHRVKGKVGFLGAVVGDSDNSIVGLNGHHLPACLNQSCRRHYCLPLSLPPIDQVLLLIRDFYTMGGTRPVSSARAISPAKFALLTHNETEDRSIRFVRVVRASFTAISHLSSYFITMEGIDENGELNVYYAKVLNVSLHRMKQLIRWQLVDESFSYDFGELGLIEKHLEQDLQYHVAPKNHIVMDWQWEMAEQSGDVKTILEENPNLFRKILNFEEDFLRVVDFCPPWELKDDIDPLPTDASDAIIPVFDATTYAIAYSNALFAVDTHNRFEDEKIYLEEVLWASKLVVDHEICYLLLLEVIDKKKELNFYYAIVQVFKSKKKLLKWHVVDEFFYDSIQKDQVAPLLPHDENVA